VQTVNYPDWLTKLLLFIAYQSIIAKSSLKDGISVRSSAVW